MAEGGLTRNLSGEEVWTLKDMGDVEERERRVTVALHLQLGTKFIRISLSFASASFSILTQAKLSSAQLSYPVISDSPSCSLSVNLLTFIYFFFW